MATDYKKWDKFVDGDETPAPAPAPRPAADGGERSEIDKLKAARRARNAAASAAGGSPASSAPAAEVIQRTEAPAASDPLSRLLAAEAALEALRAETVDVRSALASGLDAGAVVALLGRVVTAQGGVGALQAAIDEIAVGEIEDESARDDARARRKALNRAVESELMPAWVSLRADALAEKKRLGA